MAIKPTELRAHLFKFLDSVLKTGVPLEIERNGEILRIVREKKPDRLSRLTHRGAIIGSPEDLVHIDWSEDWKPHL